MQGLHKVNLSNPEKTIIVQLIKSSCALSIVDQYKQLMKFNLRELAAEASEELPPKPVPVATLTVPAEGEKPKATAEGIPSSELAIKPPSTLQTEPSAVDASSGGSQAPSGC